MSKDVYNEVARAKISDTRSLVISEYANGGYTMAQLLEVEEKEGDEPISVFLKGAIQTDKEGIKNIKEALNKINL